MVMAYPECEKMNAVQGDSQKIGAFLDWLQNDLGIVLAEYDNEDDELYRANYTIEKLLARYFDIDLDKVEQERRQMLEELRQANG
jgi:hypothetical protein